MSWRIYTSIDIGSSSIKILVGEMFKGRLIVLATLVLELKESKRVDYRCKWGYVKHQRSNRYSWRKTRCKNQKVIASIPLYSMKFNEVDGYATIDNEDGKVTGNDITRHFKPVYNKVGNDEEIVTIIPIEFVLDNKAGIKDPKGMVGKKLGKSCKRYDIKRTCMQ